MNSAAPVQVPLYELSSQYRHWRYSAKSLQDARADLNQSAISRVQALRKEEQQEQAASDNAMDAASNSSSNVAYLSVSDEIALVAYYLTQLVRLCRMFKFPSHVESTSMTYLKRFYLRNTCMDYHPKNVMLTCLFLACKTENSLLYGGIDAFTSKIPKCTREDVLGLEFLVAQSLRFEFKIHHAETAGLGIMLDMQTLLAGATANVDYLVHETWPKALSAILALRLTDAEFLYTPSQLALAAFHAADPSLTEKWLSSKMQAATASKIRPQAPSASNGTLKTENGSPKEPTAKANEDKDEISGPNPIDKYLQTAIDDIVRLYDKGKQAVNIESVRDIDRRLKYCTNPEKDPNSALYKKRAAEAEEVAQAKRAKKSESQKTFDQMDPFA